MSKGRQGQGRKVQRWQGQGRIDSLFKPAGSNQAEAQDEEDGQAAADGEAVHCLRRAAAVRLPKRSQAATAESRRPEAELVLGQSIFSISPLLSLSSYLTATVVICSNRMASAWPLAPRPMRVAYEGNKPRGPAGSPLLAGFLLRVWPLGFLRRGQGSTRVPRLFAEGT